MASKTRAFLITHFIIGIALFILFVGGLFIKISDGPYYIGVIGLGVILFPLIGLGSLYDELRAENIGVKPWYIIALSLTIVVLVVDVILAVFLVIVITCLFLTCTWSIVLSLEQKVRDRLNRFSIALTRGVFVFLIIFMYFNEIEVPARGILTDILDPFEAIFDILEGISIIGLSVFCLVISRYRIGGLVTPWVVVYVYFFPAQQVVDNFTGMPTELLPAFAVMATILVVLAVNAGLNAGRSISDTMVLVRNGHSGFFGPWFAALIKNPRYPRSSNGAEKPFTPAQKRVVKRGVVIALAMTLVILPGLLPYTNVLRIPIQIRPRTDYTMRFNFWASPYLSSYPLWMQQELKKYNASLDMVPNGGDVTPALANGLLDIEKNMSGVTYRILLYPPTIAQLPDYLENAWNILEPYAINGSIPGWRGFCFDIESYGFSDLGSNGSITQEIAIWNKAFDFIGTKNISGKPVEMESIGFPLDPADAKFDGDVDVQTLAREVTGFPDRFTTYAPMTYSAIMTGSPPYGSPEDLLHPWYTSYNVYNHLNALAACEPENKLGVYLGILNCSRYGRDLPQPEPISWGNATGFGNLIRDVLICKSFGLKEVTFFTLFTYVDSTSGWVDGGAFDTYGHDFLKVLNDTVNTNPPAHFDIYYNKRDASINQSLMLDWVLDFSRLLGILEVVAMACAAILVTSLPALVRRLKKNPEE